MTLVILSSDGNIEANRKTSKEFGTIGVPHIDDFIELEPERFQNFQSLLLSEPASFLSFS